MPSLCRFIALLVVQTSQDASLTLQYVWRISPFLCISLQGGTPAAKMEVKTSLLDNMIGVGDMVLLEPLSEDSFIANLKNRFEHNEIYVSPILNVNVTTALM